MFHLTNPFNLFKHVKNLLERCTPSFDNWFSPKLPTAMPRFHGVPNGAQGWMQAAMAWRMAHSQELKGDMTSAGLPVARCRDLFHAECKRLRC